MSSRDERLRVVRDEAVEARRSWDGLQDRVARWAERTFDHTDRAIVVHLREEVAELVHAVADADHDQAAIRRVEEEIADCAILLLTLADRNGIQVARAVGSKMLVNIERAWGPPDQNGIRHHAGHGDTP